MTDEQKEELFRLAFDYRNAHTLHAQEAWDDLLNYVEMLYELM